MASRLAARSVKARTHRTVPARAVRTRPAPGPALSGTRPSAGTPMRRGRSSRLHRSARVSRISWKPVCWCASPSTTCAASWTWPEKGLWAIDVRAMIDVDNDDGVMLLVDADKYAVVPASCAAQALQFVSQWLAQPLGIFSERARYELDDRVNYAARQSRQCATSRGGNLNAVGCRLLATHCDGSPYAARRSSSEVVAPAAYSRSASVTASDVPGRESQ